MNNALIKQSDISGPIISGTVTVNLTDLDKMRADHATLKKMCEDLEARQMEVKIVVSRDKSGVRQNSRGNFQYDSDYEFVSESYKNLDEVKELIRLNLIEEDAIKSLKLSKDYEDEKLKNSELNIKMHKIESDFYALKIKLNDENQDLKTQVQDLTNKLKTESDLNVKYLETNKQAEKLIEGFKDNISRLSSALELEKMKKGFWSFFN